MPVKVGSIGEGKQLDIVGSSGVKNEQKLDGSLLRAGAKEGKMPFIGASPKGIPCRFALQPAIVTSVRVKITVPRGFRCFAVINQWLRHVDMLLMVWVSFIYLMFSQKGKRRTSKW